MNAEARQALARLASELRRLYGPRFRELRVFGSCARGEEHAESDIDTALALSDLTSVWGEITRSGEAVARVCLDHDLVISLIPIREADLAEGKTAFARSIQREGIPVG